MVHTQNLELFPVPVAMAMWTTDDWGRDLDEHTAVTYFAVPPI